jgi:hypothetical protein
MNSSSLRHALKYIFTKIDAIMKRILLSLALIPLLSLSYGQKSIDALFTKYAGKDGFVTVTLSGDLLKLAACLDDNDREEINSIPADITEIRVLAQEDDEEGVENFYDLVIKDLDLSNYEEFMTVKQKDQDMKMLVRSEGLKFKEFLLIAGGEDNAIIQIKGNMTYREAKRFSDDVKKNHGINFTGDIK